LTNEKFDSTHQVKLVPPFQEHEVDKCKSHVAARKACEVYSTLSVEQSSDYDLVKREILRAYKLVPEAYRQRFCDAKCQDNQTYMEFACEKETLFDKWCASQQFGNNYGLRQLMLHGEFKKCVPTPIKTYLKEQ